MEGLDFYQNRLVESGVFLGSTLIQAHGSIGGNRYVFVKLIRGAKDELVYPTTGGKVVNPFKGRAKIYAGDLIEYDPGITNENGATVKVLKSYEVAADAAEATELLIVRDGYRHIPFVGDYLMVAPDTLDGTGTAATVTAVEKNTDATAGDVWKVTLSEALTANKGDVLVEASAGTGTVTAMVTNPNAFAPCDYDFLYAPAEGDDDMEGARYMMTPCLATPETYVYQDRVSPIPKAVLALNTSKVSGWFSL